MGLMRFFRRNRRDDEAAREIASYIAIETDDNIARGMPPQAAYDAAVRKFGNATSVREEIYWMNTVRPVDTIWQDLKYGARLLKRDRGFAVAAIVSLALGIGANTAIFQLLDVVRLRTLPVEEPQQLVTVRFLKGSSRSGGFTSRWPDLTYAQFEAVRAHQQIFDGLFAWSSGRLNTAAGGEVKNVEALWASGDLFTVLGLKPVIGRLIEPGDDRPGCGAPVAVISDAFWHRAYGGSPAVLQQTVRLEGTRFAIVGVTEPAFFGLDVGRRFDVAVPLCADTLLVRSRNRIASNREWWLGVMGRLPPGRTLQQAKDHLAAVSPSIMEGTAPFDYTAEAIQKHRSAKLDAVAAGIGVSDVRDEFAEPLVVLLTATALVLLIACANLANLLLARATAREREIALRLAIGASRGRIVRQLVVESVLLALIGTAFGVLVARALAVVLVAQLAGGMGAVFLDLAWNFQVLGFTAGVSTLACLLFGLAPAFKATALAPAIALKAGSRGSTAGGERFGLRPSLVVAQVALSLVLLIGALLFTRTLYNLLTIDAGFDQNVVQVDLADPSLMTDDARRGLEVRVDLQERVAAIPGVAGAVLVDNQPLGGGFWNEAVFVDGVPEKAVSNFTRVTGNYFEVIGIPIVRGRTFQPSDAHGAPPVAIVNEAFVRKLLPGRDPIGRRLWVETGPGQPSVKIEIIGVARDTKYQDIKDDFEPLVHVAMTQSNEFRDFARLLVKPRGAIDGLMPAITRKVAEINPAISVELAVIRQEVSNGLVRERLMALLSGAFGLLAGLLAAVGVYGVMSYTVTRRSNEFGIRFAMGARRADVMRMVLREAGGLIAVGIVIGTAMGLGAAKAARSLLFGLQPGDPLTMASAIALLATIGLIASYLPARRASRVDPMNVLRQE
jgi:putative ABC transport system permease protein